MRLGIAVLLEIPAEEASIAIWLMILYHIRNIDLAVSAEFKQYDEVMR